MPEDYTPSHQCFIIENLFRIYDKQGNLVDFKLNEVQRRIDQEVIQPGVLRSSITKFRQGGCTSLVMAWFLVECLSGYCQAVMLAHDKDHTEKLLRRAQLILQHMKGLQPEVSRMNDNEIVFKKTDASFYIGTAGTKQFGRSATITHLHMSEFAFWKDPESLMLGLMQAIPKDSGKVIIETTGNGWGTFHQKHFYDSLSKKNSFKALFFPWYSFQEYVSDCHNLDMESLTKAEATLMAKYNVTLEQLQWRRDKLNDEFKGNETLFNQEYPSEVQDAFRLTGGSLFSDLELHSTPRWVVGDPVSYLEGHPHKGLHYSMGVDSSGGTGNDNSSINILCLETKEQVYEFNSSRLNPVVFARRVADIAMRFNEAYITVEQNSHGLSVLAVLREIYPRNLLYRQTVQTKSISGPKTTIPALQYGWRTSSTTKPYMVSLAQDEILNGMKVHGPRTFDELVSFSEDPDTGKMEGIGDHDDSALSFMLACVGLQKLRKRYTEHAKVDPKIYNNPRQWRTPEGKLLGFGGLFTFEDVFKPKKNAVEDRWTRDNNDIEVGWTEGPRYASN